MIIDKTNCEHYYWGSNCEGWRLVNEKSLSVIEESMPPGTAEKIHFHQHATQLFYIQEGTAVFMVNQVEYEVHTNQSFLIKPGEIHQIKNNTSGVIRFLVISQPTTQGDRLEI